MPALEQDPVWGCGQKQLSLDRIETQKQDVPSADPLNPASEEDRSFGGTVQFL